MKEHEGVIYKHALNYPLNSIDLIDYCINKGLLKELNECRKINDAYYHRQKRLRDRVETMLLNGACLFLTLTFNNETLETTTPEQRRKRVQRFLKEYNCLYVANIDFGKENGREHYHALINTDKVNGKEWRKNNGDIDFKRVRNKDINNDKTKLAKYIAKLSNHAIKETTKRSVLIYSR